MAESGLFLKISEKWSGDEEIDDKKDSESEKVKKEKNNNSKDSKNTEETSKPETVTKESGLDGK